MLFGILLLLIQASAAPSPGMGSSALVSPRSGWFLARHGFRLSTADTNWNFDPSSSLEGDEAKFRVAPSSGSGSLLVKTETLTSEISVENYARRWLKDYTHFGFSLMGSKPFTQGNAKGLVVDLFHSHEKKQSRQAIFLKGRRAVVMTCTDKAEGIKESLDACNKIIKSFEWVD